MITSLIIYLLVGACAGWLANRILGFNSSDLVKNLVLGIIGGIVGGLIGSLIGLSATNLIGSIILAVIGALVVEFVYHRFLK